MKDHYDIGVVGCWYWGNYGSVLNGYATYKILTSFGLSVLNIVTPHNGFEPHVKRFIKEMYPQEDISETLPFERVAEYNNYCEMFLTGSDQIWNFREGQDIRYTKFFRLDFAEESKKRVSFATSFGAYIPEKEGTQREFKKLFERYSALSTREDIGVEILENRYGVGATQIMEPVFNVETNVFYELAEHSQLEEEKEPYLLTYILDPSPDKKKAIEFYAKKLGIKTVNILDGFSANHEKNKKLLGLPGTLPNIWCADFVKYFMNASYVITDSFHGTAFAIIFNKEFISIANYERGIERFVSLLSKMNLQDRLVNSKAIPADEKYLHPMNFSYANEIIDKERERAIEWLKNAISVPKKELASVIIPDNTVIKSLKKEMCTGCGACVSICPTEALKLEADGWGYYRSKLEIGKCIECGKCVKVCPAIKLPERKNLSTPSCYEVIAADADILFGSSSGGIFPLLAQKIFEKDGCVVGAAWTDDLSVKHIMIDDEVDLPKLQKSKYLQSYLGNMFKDVERQLKNNKSVLFSGCPCQVAGLHTYLGVEYDNLISVDLLCANAPSTAFFKKYIADTFPEGVKKYEFRNKTRGWNCVCVKVDTVIEKDIIRMGGKEDDYQRVFHNHTMCAPHCEKCKYQKAPRLGDLTMGDFWGIGGKDPELDTKQGVSVVLCNNQKGKAFLESIGRDKTAVKKEVPLWWLGGNGYAINDSRNYAPPKRNVFYKAIKEMPFSEAVNFASKPNKGQYDEIYSRSNAALQYNAAFLHFEFEQDVWEEHYINRKTVLVVKPGMSKIGRFACIPLAKPLKKNYNYSCEIKFQVKSESSYLNFHIKDSGSDLYQVIRSYSLPKARDNSEIIKLNFEFIADSDIYDQFMIGASQIKGKENYISFSSIQIMDKDI